MIVSLLFTAVLKDNESVIIRGKILHNLVNPKELSNLANTLATQRRWNMQEIIEIQRQSIACLQITRIRDENGFIKTEVLAIDAIRFGRKEDQFSEAFITREMNKAYCGFRDESKKHIKIATGSK